MQGRHVILTTLAVAIVVVGGVSWYIGVDRQVRNRIDLAYPEGVPAIVPIGISAGSPPPINFSIDNPLAGDPNATQDGYRLFLSMNCASCHGYDAKGGMGPNLTDAQWRYGGRPVDLYKSIYEGRPKGMPAWGNAIPSNTIWQLVAYIQSLGGSDESGSAAANQQAAAEEGQ